MHGSRQRVSTYGLSSKRIGASCWFIGPLATWVLVVRRRDHKDADADAEREWCPCQRKSFPVAVPTIYMNHPSLSIFNTPNRSHPYAALKYPKTTISTARRWLSCGTCSSGQVARLRLSTSVHRYSSRSSRTTYGS